MVGAGGLGCPAALYLAAAGIGRSLRNELLINGAGGLGCPAALCLAAAGIGRSLRNECVNSWSRRSWLSSYCISDCCWHR